MSCFSACLPLFSVSAPVPNDKVSAPVTNDTVSAPVTDSTASAPVTDDTMSAPVTDETEYDLSMLLQPVRRMRLPDAERSGPKWIGAVDDRDIVAYDCKRGGVVPLERIDAQSRTAYMLLEGTFSPFTAAHLGTLLLARDVLAGFEPGTQMTGGIEKSQGPYDYVIASVSFNTDAHTAKKYAEKFCKGDAHVWDGFFTQEDRARLWQVAFKEFPWIHLTSEVICSKYLEARVPGLDTWRVRGADTMLKYRMYKQKFHIAIGRRDTDGSLEGLRQRSADYASDFILTRPLPDVSSTAVGNLLIADSTRAALRSGLHPDTSCLLLHPATAKMLVDGWDAYKGKRETDQVYRAAKDMFDQKVAKIRAAQQ